MNKTVFHALALIMLVLGLNANAYAEEQKTREPRALLIEAHDKVIEKLENEEEKAKLASDPEYLEKTLDNLLSPYVDYVGMGRLMLGKQWKAASKEQQNRFVKEFRGMLARVYGKSIAFYDGQKLVFQEFQKDKKLPKRLGAIRATLGNDGGLPIDFFMRLRKAMVGRCII